MELVLGTLWKDLLLAAALGAVGGMGLGLLQEKGLEMPHWHNETGVNFADLGFISDIFIGALAAVIVYALNPPAGMLQLVSSGEPTSPALHISFSNASERRFFARAFQFPYLPFLRLFHSLKVATRLFSATPPVTCLHACLLEAN